MGEILKTTILKQYFKVKIKNLCSALLENKRLK